MSNKSFIVTTRMNQTVFKDFGSFHNFFTSNRWTKLFLIPIFMIILGILNYFNGRIGYSIFIILIGFLFPLISIFQFRFSMKKQIKVLKIENGRGQLVYTTTLDEESLLVHNNKEKIRLRWDQLQTAYILDDYIFLYIAKNKAYILPYTDLKEATKEELQELVKSQMSKKSVIDKRKKSKGA